MASKPKRYFKLSLRPYNGELWIAKTKEAYDLAHKRIFKEPDVAFCEGVAGRFSGGANRNGMWAYLIWAPTPAIMAHELSHVIFATFNRCGIDPRNDEGEAFCYMLSQLMMEALDA
mgnify:CR=1 FL=1